MYSGPLAGVRVLDFSRVLAGPHCAQTLGDLGSAVIKVEPPNPDISRFAAPTSGHMSGYYAQQNSGKRNISVDLWTPEGREIVRRLCIKADIIVENFRPGTLASFGFGYNDVAKLKERIVYVSISGFGQGGPWQGRMAYAPTVEAEAGLTELTHRHHGQPEHVESWRTDSLSHGDVYTGLQACVAAIAALRESDRSGCGQHVDIAMAATLVRSNERVHADIGDQASSVEPAVLGATETPFFVAPEGGIVATSTSLVSNLTFPSWVRAMRQPRLLNDRRFSSTALRVEHLGQLRGMVQTWMYTFGDDAALDAQLDEAKIAFGHVRSLEELRQTDWADYWGAFVEVDDRNGSTYTIPGRPWRFSRGIQPNPGIPAWQGEHNSENSRRTRLLRRRDRPPNSCTGRHRAPPVDSDPRHALEQCLKGSNDSFDHL